MSASGGRVLRPKKGERLIVHIENLELSRKDKWGCSRIVALLQQIISHNGFYNDNQQWVAIEKTQFIFSLFDENDELNSRFTSLLRMCRVDDVTNAEKMAVLNNFCKFKVNTAGVNVDKLSFTEIERIRGVDEERLNYELDMISGNVPVGGYVYAPNKKTLKDYKEVFKICELFD